MMETVRIELLGDLPLYIGLGVQSVVALVLGGMIGYDREKRSKAAGLKTHMLICLGASIFTSMGVLIAIQYGNPADPNRIAAQIVSGIGFLGAGAIIRGNEHVTGLTSAATIWLVAAIGYTVGIGYIFTASAFTLTVFFVLVAMVPVYKLLETEKNYQYFQIEVLSMGSVKRILMGVVLSEEVEVDEVFEETLDTKKGQVLTSIFLKAHMRQVERIAYDLRSLIKVKKVTFHSVAGSIRKILKGMD